MAQEWGIRRPSGVADGACFARHGHSTGSIAEEFRKFGVYWRRARKGNRIAGWATLRRMMEDEGRLLEPVERFRQAARVGPQSLPALLRRLRSVSVDCPACGSSGNRAVAILAG